MRSTRLAFSSVILASLLFAAPSFAQEPAAPAAQPAEAAPAADAPAALPPTSPAPAAQPTAPAVTAERPAAVTTSDRPAEAEGDGDTRRDGGLRLGLDLGFQRAFNGAADRLNAGTPTLLPIGLELGLRTSKTLVVAMRGYAALASRDDCISADSCRARAYGLGFAIEHALGRGPSFVPWIRYGAGYEITYQGGAPLDPAGHLYRGAFDLLDLRVGGDFIAGRGNEGKTARIGAFLGLVGGVLVNQSGVSTLDNGANGRPRNLDRDSGSAHLWFVMGVRGTLDP